jgi:hypothetical protein
VRIGTTTCRVKKRNQLWNISEKNVDEKTGNLARGRADVRRV